MICFENRNGILAAYDVELGSFLNPLSGVAYAGIKDAADGLAEPLDPEDFRSYLERRGETEVLVYAGPTPSWVDGSIQDRESRLRKFAHMASQVKRASKVWPSVPVERIGDGSDWSDIYPAATAR